MRAFQIVVSIILFFSINAQAGFYPDRSIEVANNLQIQGEEVLPLRTYLNQMGVRVRNHKLLGVSIYAKSKHGAGEATLIVGHDYHTQVVPQAYTWSSLGWNSWHTDTFNLMEWDLSGQMGRPNEIWQLHFNGNIKLESVVVHLVRKHTGKVVVKPGPNKKVVNKIVINPGPKKKVVNKIVINPKKKKVVNKIVINPKKKKVVNKVVINPKKKVVKKKVVKKPGNTKVVKKKVVKKPGKTKVVKKKVVKKPGKNKVVKKKVVKKPGKPKTVKKKVVKKPGKKKGGKKKNKK